ncbi:protein mono-ADP-ribosyltransferase TIPARP-like [Leuresthes tenuis]|uniref:protein mono-ADP-ribosyltransferase TIPARP-like n=1 Tax=Leuresthes tenuis TaxID=355514 RepID=UPI003B5085B8
MAGVSCRRGMKRDLTAKAVAASPSSKLSKATTLSPCLLLLEIPADANTSLPVWDAFKSKQVDIKWTVSPYSISVQLTPMTSKQGNSRGSCKSGNATSISCRVLQQQIQSVIQHHAAPQNTSHGTLALSQNTNVLPCPTCHLEKTPPSSPAASFSASLPFVSTQPQFSHQPGSLTCKEVPSTTQSPASTSTCKPLAQSDVPSPLSFCTKSAADINICDNFLLGICGEGVMCKMHHTAYPFHWQLMSVSTHQWMDLSPRCQVLLERIYCDVDQEYIYLEDGDEYYALDFDVMQLDDLSKYNGVRRLTNSDSTIRNPHFPSKWKIYWWNEDEFQEYTSDLSACLLNKMSKKEPACSFHIGTQEYRMDFTTMTQVNVTTGFQREVRYRPVYRSPQSMRPYLRTGIQSDLTPSDGVPPGSNFSVDPLEEFSTWYPPVWSPASEHDYSLVDVPVGTQAYQSILKIFYDSLPETKVDIIGIQQLQNPLHWDKYQRQKIHMQKQRPKSKKPLERHLFHGTTKDASESICHNNFDPRAAGVNGNSLGYGSYFATTACMSDYYASLQGSLGVRHIFLAKVLVGRASVGKHNYRRPPSRNSKRQRYALYDSCTDNRENPKVFVVFDSCQCYPYYLIKYKMLPEAIYIHE